MGIVDDGAGVPMAFGVVEPREWAATASLREGALEAGLAQLEDASGTDPETQARVAAIETVLGRTVGEDGLFVTADRGVRYEDGVLYRRAQPGQPRLNRMETDLYAGGCRVLTGDPCDLLDGGPVAAEELQVSGDGTVGGAGTVATRTSVGEAGSPTSLSVGTPADPAAGTAAVPGEITAVEVRGDSGLTVAAHLVVGSAVAISAVTTGGMTVFVDAARSWTGRAEAGAVDAAVLTAQGDFTIDGVATVTGVSSVGSLDASDLRASSGVSVEAGGSGGFQGLYGPRATIQNLTVGSCAGCYSP